MPNVSASLSDEAYRVWMAHQGKKSPWVSKLIIEGETILAKNEALEIRVGYLMGLLSSMMTELKLSKQGVNEEEWAERTLLLLDQCMDALDGTVHMWTSCRSIVDVLTDSLELLENGFSWLDFDFLHDYHVRIILWGRIVRE